MHNDENARRGSTLETERPARSPVMLLSARCSIPHRFDHHDVSAPHEERARGERLLVRFALSAVVRVADPLVL